MARRAEVRGGAGGRSRRSENKDPGAKEPWTLHRIRPMPAGQKAAHAVKISVVTPSFNQCGFLSRTAESILSQRGDFELEWIVIDGGSTDGSVELLRGIADPRLRVISEPDRGQSHALNKGLVLAAGDVIAWLNADDLYPPGALAAVAEAFTAHPDAGWLVGRLRDHRRRRPTDPPRRRAIQGAPPPPVFLPCPAPRELPPPARSFLAAVIRGGRGAARRVTELDDGLRPLAPHGPAGATR